MSKLVYIVGSGGRESALALALKEYKVVILPDKEATLIQVKKQKPDLVVIGSEQPLVDGLADDLRSQKIKVFGPSKKAAQLEASKSFTESFLERHNISRPKSQTVTNATIDTYKLPNDVTTIVLKADGLAGGKGVILPSSKGEAKQVLKDMLSGSLFGQAGNKVVIQERLHGPEVSVFAVTDGTNFVILPFTQDHKRLKNNDIGPNTGGMGAYTPIPKSIVSDNQAKKIHKIVEQSINGMRTDGNEFRGVLYIGLMMAEQRGGDPVVIEYNVRFGDPEAQVLLPYLSSYLDVYSLLESTDDKLIDIPNVDIKQSFITVCLAAKGYPQTPDKGQQIYGLDKKYKNTHIYLAAVLQQDDKYYTNSGRVLYVTGYGDSIDQAAKHAYQAIGPNAISFDGMQYRTDIGWQARS